MGDNHGCRLGELCNAVAKLCLATAILQGFPDRQRRRVQRGEQYGLRNVVNSPPPAPVIKFPVHDGDSIWAASPLRWTKSADPNGQAVKYRVLINHNNSGYVQFATDVKDTSVLLEGYDMLGFKFKVIAYDSVGDSSEWSGERTFFIKGIFPSNLGVISIAIDGEGNKWFGTNGGGALKFDGSTWTAYTTTNGLAGNDVYAIAIDGQDNKWFGTNNAISKFDGTAWTTYNGPNNLATMVYSIAIDRQNMEWFGTAGTGHSNLMAPNGAPMKWPMAWQTSVSTL